ncbi:MAG: redox-regulated ATPase YchF [archaeon]|nr:MAG: redox-regulated ATPase YchF [archaeon]
MLIGVVGKTNVGKSTFFKAATLAEVEISNRPFVTIKPNHGIGYVKVNCPDSELKVKCKPKEGFCINSKRFVPVGLLDVAGLVPGAHQGKGLGNQFLDDLRQADVLIHVIDASGTTDEEGKPCENYDPCKDVLFLEEELDRWYYGILNKKWKAFSRKMSVEHEEFVKAVTDQFSGLKITQDIVKTALKNSNLNLEVHKWTHEELFFFAQDLRKLSKPMIIAANKVDKAKGEENLKRIKESFPNYLVVPCSAEIELALREAAKEELIEYAPGESDFKIIKELDEKRKKGEEYMKKFLEKWKTTGVQDVLNKAVFEFLDYIYVFPVENTKLTDSKGNVLPDCLLLPKGSTAIDLAYRVHTDIGDKFVKAMNMKKRIPIGKNHALENGDVVEIITK